MRPFEALGDALRWARGSATGHVGLLVSLGCRGGIQRIEIVDPKLIGASLLNVAIYAMEADHAASN